jgi:hypothetical protein
VKFGVPRKTQQFIRRSPHAQRYIAVTARTVYTSARLWKYVLADLQPSNNFKNGNPSCAVAVHLTVLLDLFNRFMQWRPFFGLLGNAVAVVLGLNHKDLYQRVTFLS